MDGDHLLQCTGLEYPADDIVSQYWKAQRQMVKKPVSEFERGLIIGMKTAGWSTRRVAVQMDRSECAVRNCWKQWTREGTHGAENRSEATRKSTRREDRRIVRQALVDPTVTRSTIRAGVGVAIVPQTISRHLTAANLKSKRPFQALPLTPEHRQRRLQWCQARSMWNVTDWQKIVLSDESRFVLGTDDNRVWVWRSPGEQYNSPHCSTPHCPHSWCNGLGDIAYDSRSTLIVMRETLAGQRDVDDIRPHRFVEWDQSEIAVVPDFHKRILFSDKTHFWLNGYVNKQNCRIWSEANPQVYVETPLHPEKLTFGTLYGLVESFFKNDEGHNVTVNGDRYRAMINNFFIPELNNHDVQELWFQQDGATCHTARATIDLLKDTFGDRLISRFGPVNWPQDLVI
ncbi:transposable element Tcb1 transposase [Trichonephila clavipes]|nr:transposable element Tcb1 transposase [Trichonephila clavipes]